MKDNRAWNRECRRCGDKLRPEDGRSIGEGRVELNRDEQLFISSRFSVPLCAACHNQLKSSYRIMAGVFD